MAKGKVLVVDDERAIVTVIETNLRLEGYDVVKAYNGEEALARVAEEKPDLVLLDVMMPVMDGWTVLKRLREAPETLDIPVVMLTALSQDADIARGWEEGVDCYLTKPFEPDELIEMVARILQAKQEEDQIAGLGEG